MIVVMRKTGTVSRGICEIEDGLLKSVTEHTALDKNSGFPMDTVVSMNMWGFDTTIFDELEKRFVPFLNNLSNPQKEEFFLPFVVDELLKEGKVSVKVLDTTEKWYGVTYKEDKQAVVDALRNKVAQGVYPEKLW